MADIEYFEDGYGRGGYGGDGGYSQREAASGGAEPGGLAAILNWVGALMAVALVLAMALWAWNLTTRDVSGVPVIRALEGPLRVAPDDPGGIEAEHQGLAVNRISEGEEAAPAADRIVLAPAPLDLEEVDLSSASLPEVSSIEAPVAEEPVVTASEETEELIERLLAEATPLEATTESAEAEAETGIDTISSTIPGVRVSPRPRGRPADLRVASLETANDASPAAASDVLELAAADLPTGTRLVQLGAFDDAETARAEWQRLERRFPDFFRGKDRVIQQAVSGGREFFRLRAHGFEDLSDARRFCTALNAQGTACISVTVR